MNRVLSLRTAAATAACFITLLPTAATACGPRHVDSIRGSAELAIGVPDRATIDASGSPTSAKGHIRFQGGGSWGNYRAKVDCLWVHEISPGSTDAWVSGRIVSTSGHWDTPPSPYVLFLVHTYKDPRGQFPVEQTGLFTSGPTRFNCTAFERDDNTDAWRNGQFRVQDNDSTN